MTHDQDARGWKARAEAAEAKVAQLIAIEDDRQNLAERLETVYERLEAAESRLAEVEKERDKYARACTTMVEKLNEVEKDRDYFAEQSKVAQKLVGTYRARAERLREGLRWLLPLLDPMNMTPSEHEVYESLAADSAAPSGEHDARDVEYNDVLCKYNDATGVVADLEEELALARAVVEAAREVELVDDPGKEECEAFHAMLKAIKAYDKVRGKGQADV